jgi:hypothetical protein
MHLVQYSETRLKTTLKHRVLLARLKGLSHEIDLAFHDMYGPVLYLGLEPTIHVIKGQIHIVRQSL